MGLLSVSSFPIPDRIQLASQLKYELEIPSGPVRFPIT